MKRYLLNICKIGFIVDILFLLYEGIRFGFFIETLPVNNEDSIKKIWLTLQYLFSSFFTMIGINYFTISFVLFWIVSKIIKKDLQSFVYILFPIFIFTHLYFLFLITFATLLDMETGT